MPNSIAIMPNVAIAAPKLFQHQASPRRPFSKNAAEITATSVTKPKRGACLVDRIG